MVPPDDLDLDDVDVLEPGPPAWAALAGQWSFEGPHAHYNGPDPDEPLADLGLAVTDETLLKGTVSALISLPDTTAAGRLMFGHDPETGEHLSCGIGGGRWAYVLDQFVLGRGWITLLARGFHTNLALDTEYAVTVAVLDRTRVSSLTTFLYFRTPFPDRCRGVKLELWHGGVGAFASATSKSARSLHACSL